MTDIAFTTLHTQEHVLACFKLGSIGLGFSGILEFNLKITELDWVYRFRSRGMPVSRARSSPVPEAAMDRSSCQLRNNANFEYNGCDFNVHTHHT